MSQQWTDTSAKNTNSSQLREEKQSVLKIGGDNPWHTGGSSSYETLGPVQETTSLRTLGHWGMPKVGR